MTDYQPAITVRIQRIERSLTPSDTFRSLITRRHSIEESMTRYSVPGLNVAVINDGQLEWAKGYGVREAGQQEPVTTETLFQCASISKPVATFYMEAVNAEVTFARDKTNHLKFKQNGQEIVAKKIN